MSDNSTLHKLRLQIDAYTKPAVEKVKKMQDVVKKAKEEVEHNAEQSGKGYSKAAKEIETVNTVIDKVREKVSDATGEITDDMNEWQRTVQMIKNTFGHLADGSIFQKQTKQVQEFVDEAKKASGMKINPQVDPELPDKLDKAQKKLDGLVKKQKELKESGQQKVETQEYKELTKDIEKAEKKLNDLVEKQEKFDAIGVRKTSQSYKGLLYDMEQARNTLAGYKADAENMVAENAHMEESASWRENKQQIKEAREEITAYRQEVDLMASGSKTSPFEAGGSVDLSNTRQEIGKVGTAAAGTTSKVSGLVSSIGGLGGILGWLTSATKKTVSGLFNGMDSAISKVTEKIKSSSGAFSSLIHRFANGVTGSDRFNKSLKRTNRTTDGLSGSVLRLGNMFRLMLVRMAMRSVISGAQEGFKELAKYSDQVNRSISMLMSTLAQLKYSFAAAFAPVLNFVAPLLNSLLKQVVNVTNAVGQLFAALSGQSFYTVAIPQQLDYAASLDDAASAADKAKDAADAYKASVLGFDELNKMDDQGSVTPGGAGVDDGAGNYFDTRPVENKFQELANKIKDVAKRIFKPMQDAWRDHGQGVMDAWKGALDEVLGLAGDIGETFLEVWEDGTGYRTTSNILIVLKDIGMWIRDIAKAWRGAWSDYGHAFVKSIFNTLNNILELIHSISEAFRKVWNDGTGERICGLILQILTNISNIVGNLAGQFKKAWDENERGERIAKGIFGIIESILGTIERITGATAEWAETVDFGPLLDSIGNLLERIRELVDIIGAALSELWEKVVLPFLSWLIEKGLPWVIDLMGNIAPVIGKIVDAIKEIALQFTEAWTEGGRGERILNAISDLVYTIVGIIERVVDATKDWAKNVDFAPLLESVAGLLESMQPVLKYLGELFQDMWQNKVLPFLTYMIEDGLPKALDWISKVFDFLADHPWVIDAIISAVEIMVGGFLAIKKAVPIITAVAGAFVVLSSPIGPLVTAVLGIGTAILTVMKNFDSLKEKFSRFSENGKFLVQGFVDGIKKTFMSSSGLGKIVKLFTQVIDAVKGVFKIKSPSVVMNEIGVFIVEGLIKGIGSLIDAAAAFFSDLLSGIHDTFSNLPDWFRTKFGDAYAKVTDSFKDAKTYFGTKYTEVTTAFTNAPTWFSTKFKDAYSKASGAFSNAGSFFSGVYSNITDKFHNIPNWFQTKFSDAWTKVKNVFSSGGKVFDGIKDGILEGLKGVINGLIRGINKVVAVPFNGLNSALRRLSNIKIAGRQPFSWMPTIDVPSIPYLKTGGLVGAGQLFVANEAGPELIGSFGGKTAVMNNNQIVQSVSAGVYEAVTAAMMNTKSDEKEVYLEFTFMAGDETFYRMVRKATKKHDRRFHAIAKT